MFKNKTTGEIAKLGLQLEELKQVRSEIFEKYCDDRIKFTYKSTTYSDKSKIKKIKKEIESVLNPILDREIEETKEEIKKLSIKLANS